MAFYTPTGHYEYLVKPLDLTNASAVFQALVNDVLRDMVRCFACVYLDDILIFSKDLMAQQAHVCSVIFCLLQNNLFISAEKCEFHKPYTSVLAFIISNKISMDLSKTDAVKNWPLPQDRRQL